MTVLSSLRYIDSRLKKLFLGINELLVTDFKAQNFLGQQYEAKLSLFILNKMMAIRMPKTAHIA